MHDYRPHSFDTRGFLWSLGILAVVIGLAAAGGKYGAPIAQYVLHSNQVAAAESAATPEPAAAAEPAEELATSPNTEPSAFTVRDVPVPKVTARSFIVADAETGVIYAQKGAMTSYPMASITKLLTAYVALQTLGPTTTPIHLTEEDRRLTFGSPGSITRDESLSMEDAFHVMLTESNNTIANALARTAGWDAFIETMVAVAREAGMTATFEDPSGISMRNAGSPLDILLLTRFIHDRAPQILAMTRETDLEVTAHSGRTYHPTNYNVLTKGDDRFIGGKVGYTDAARQTMTTVFQIPVETGRPSAESVGMETATATAAIIVLGSENRREDIQKLLRWFESAVEPVTPAH